MNKICISVLMLGAAAIAVPAMAQAADNNASAAESAQAAPSNNQANDNAQAAGAANESSQAAADASTSPSAAPSAKTAMNSSSTAAANADVSSVGNTSKKYHRAARARDFAAEKKITQQLNQQASIAAKPTQTASNQ